MRLTALFLLGFALHVSARVNSQTVTFSGKDVHLLKVLQIIKEQTGYVVLYNPDLISKAPLVSVSAEKLPLAGFLKMILRPALLTYSIESKNIVIKKASGNEAIDMSPATDPLDVRFQEITGTLINASTNEPLAGASVTIKGSKNTVVSDSRGNFVIQAKLGDILVISYIGYESKEVTAGSAVLDKIFLQAASSNMQEIVVNKGYYAESKRLTTASVSRISAADMEKQPVSNPLAALQGRVTGVVITQRTGAPGGAFDIQIRGRNSISSGNQPFYVVDGVPFTSQSLSLTPSTQASLGGNPLNNLNMADIECIEILKDADAVAIYGSRGANGVVLITTKKARSGNAGFDVNVYKGIGQVPKFSELLNTKQYLEMRREAFVNDGKIPSASRQATGNQVFAPDLMIWDTSRYTDWQKELIGGTAHYTDAQAAFSGGNANTRFLISSGLHRETTVFSSDAADTKVSVRFNLNHSSTNQKFKIGFTGSYLRDRNELPRNDLTQSALTLPPNAPRLYTADGSLNWENGTFTNPLQNSLRKYRSTTGTLIGNATISYEIIKGLQLKAMVGYTTMQMKEINTVPLASSDPNALPASTASNFADQSIFTWIAEPQAEYTKRFGRSRITALAGATLQQNLQEGMAFTASGYTNDALLYDIRSATTIISTSAPYRMYRYNGAFGRINYTFSDKYIVNITGRRDGSSRFGPGRQFADFYSAGAAWIFSDEKLVKQNLRFLSFGKLRGSVGSTGSDNITDYGFMDLWSSTNYSYLGVKGPVANKLFNPDYRWEETRKLEAGINLGFLNNRISVSANYYRNRSSNQLIGQVLPDMTGFASVTMNRDATVDNMGWEIELNADIIKRRGFTWNSGVNLTIARNKLVAYPDLATSADNAKYLVGQPLTILRLMQVTVDPANGSYRFINAKGDMISLPSSVDDYVRTVNLAPAFYGGFQNQFSYKRFSLDVLFQFVKQKGNNGISTQLADPGTANNQPVEVMNRWRKAGDQTDVTRFKLAGEITDTYRFLIGDLSSDASFIRLKNVAISYTLPQAVSNMLKMKNARIYLKGQNLFTITSYKGLDPETLASANLPVLRVFAAGLQLNF